MTTYIVVAIVAFVCLVAGYLTCAMMSVAKSSDELADRLHENMKRGKESNMSNMSYCRFANTGPDIIDCTNAVREAMDDDKTIEQFRQELSSKSERAAFDRMRDYCQDFIDAYNTLAGGKYNG